MALDALCLFVLMVLSGCVLGGLVVSVVIVELSVLIEVIVLRDSLVMEEDDNASATREIIASFWSVVEIE